MRSVRFSGRLKVGIALVSLAMAAPRALAQEAARSGEPAARSAARGVSTSDPAVPAAEPESPARRSWLRSLLRPRWRREKPRPAPRGASAALDSQVQQVRSTDPTSPPARNPSARPPERPTESPGEPRLAQVPAEAPPPPSSEIPAPLTLPRAEQPGGGGMPTTATAETLEAEQPKENQGPTFFLNQALGLQDSPVHVYGWLQNSFTGNTNGTPKDRLNFSVFPNRLANQWQGNQYYIVLENPIEMNDRPNLGFRLDTLFGNDWQFTKDIGLFDRAFHINSFAGVDFPQVYGEMHLPILTRGGLDIKGGRWYSPCGYEAVMAVNRPLLSVPYMLNFTPFTFFGLLTTLHLTDRINLVNGTINGPDRWLDESYKWGYMYGLTWTSKDGKSTLNFHNCYFHAQLPRFLPADMTFTPTGNPPPPFLAGRINPFYSSLRRYFSLTVTHQWSDKLTEVMQMEQIFDPRILGFGPTARSISWAGLGHWLLYAFNEKVTGVWRSEAFWDNQGAATGLATTFYEITLGFNYRPRPWLYIRPEARYDWVRSGHPFNDGTRASQFLLAIDVILRF